MELTEYTNIYQNEKHHFFYVSIHNLIVSLIQKSQLKNPRILDAGCGTGYLAKLMAPYGQVVGIDISPEALSLAKKNGIQTKRGSVEHLPFKSKTFDLVVCIDVLYHQQVKSDFQALREFYRVLKPNGKLILRVASNKWLHLHHDRFVHTKRRYNQKELMRKLKKCNFNIEFCSPVQMALLPLAAIKMLWERLTPQRFTSGVDRPAAVINQILIWWLLRENKFILSGHQLPWGLGLTTVARKDRV